MTTKQELQEAGWVIEEQFHQEEAYYYYTAKKGRNILTSDDGATFHGQLDGVWV